MFTKREIIYIALGAALLIGVAIVTGAYIHAKVQTAVADTVKKDVQEQISALKSELHGSLDKIQHDRSEAKTPQQIVQKLPQYIELPKPIIISGPSTAASNLPSGNPAELPSAPSATRPVDGNSLTIPAESVTAFWQHETACKENELKLAECQKEIPLITKRAEAAEKAMRGGGFFSRLKANSKWMVVGATAGIVIGKVVIH